jgi:type III pantothenate kinase
MKVDIVAEVGNTRIKWGKCGPEGVGEYVSLPVDEAAWEKQIKEWNLGESIYWAVAGVQPGSRDQLVKWLRQRKDPVQVLDNYLKLPLQVQVRTPEHVGIDRLLNAVAAKWEGGRVDCTIMVDAGSAVTVDWLDEKGVFRGGAIFPGCRLMALALHTYTALLPRVELLEPNPPLPGTDTTSAMRAGIYWAVAGGIKALIRQFKGSYRHTKVFLTGGDAALLLPVMESDIRYWPQMTLEGVRLSAEIQP